MLTRRLLSTLISQTLFEDDYVDTDGTLLEAHTPNTDLSGLGWNQREGSVEIVGNKARPVVDITDNIYTFSTTKNNLEITVSIDWIINSSNPNGIILRWSDINNYWRIITNTDAGGSMFIQENNGGVFTTRASATGAFTPSSSNILTINASGQTITADTDGTEISYGLASHNELQTTHGIYLTRRSRGIHNSIVAIG